MQVGFVMRQNENDKLSTSQSHLRSEKGNPMSVHKSGTTGRHIPTVRNFPTGALLLFKLIRPLNRFLQRTRDAIE